jgi:peptidoglycan/LPS O-acetylase OafA/YrhL
MIEPMTVIPKSFRRDIAGLRALAVMLVLLNHFQIPGFGFGFIGVDIFFVISGFLITRVLYKDFVFSNAGDPGKSFLSLSSFYLRRIRRLLPAAFAVILLVNLISYFLYNSESKSSLQTDSKWALLFLANVSFLRSQSDYFQQNSEPSMLLHYWSLSVEEQFYFIWPILFLIAASLHRMKIRGKFFRFDRRILSLILVVSLFSFAFLQYGSETAPTEAYFSIFTRAWELGVGSFFGILAFHKRPESHFSKIELYSPLFLSILVSFVFISDSNWAIYVALPVLTTGFFLYAGQGNLPTSEKKSQRFMPVQETVQFIGKISYSLYLVHWPIFVIFNHFNLLENSLVTFSLIPISTLCGYLLWKYIEIPFQRITIPKRINWDETLFHFVKARRALIGILALLLVGSLYLVTYPELPRQFLSNKGDLISSANQENLQRFAEYEGELLSGESSGSPAPLIAADTQTGSVKVDLEALESQVISDLKAGISLSSINQLSPNVLATLTNDASPFEKSACAARDSEVPMDCASGNRAPDAKRVALVGDSKMGHFAQPLIEYFSGKDWLVESFIMNGCKSLNPKDDFRKNCPARSKWILDHLKSNKYDLVVIASWPTDGGSEARNYLRSIQEVSSHLIVFLTTPQVRAPRDCITPINTYTLECQTIDPKLMPSMVAAHKAAKSLNGENTFVVNSDRWVCVANICPYLSGDQFVSRDGSHLSYSYVRKITPLIFATLDSIKTW